MCYSQDDLVVDPDDVVASALVVLALLAQLVLHNGTTPADGSNLAATVKDVRAVGMSDADAATVREGRGRQGTTASQGEQQIQKLDP